MKFYLQVQADGTITDVITYPYENYIEYEADSVPIGVNGGWFKLENGLIVEYPDLKPINESDQIIKLKENQVATNRAVDETSTTVQQLLELLDELGVIS